MKKILVAEDNHILRNNLKTILGSNGFDVYTSANGIECLRMSARIMPDLIISDIVMPEMDGIELLQKIRTKGLNSTIPFIFLTARSTYEELRRGMSMGADDYLFKPINIKDLLQSINTVLEKYESYENRLKELRDCIALTIPHEFRTPLTAILGYTEILKEEIAHTIENDEIRTIINNLSDSAKRFNNLVQKFTNYTNVVLLLNDEKSVAAIMNRTVFSSRVIIQTNALKVAEHFRRLNDIEIMVEDVVLRYDETYLSFIIEELVNNAMRYSKCGSKVSIKSVTENDKYTILVRDEGIGITPEQIRNIAAFKQFTKDAFSGTSGNGIGLVTVKKIADLTGLNFMIESIPGKYTETAISIPCPLP